MQAAVKHTIVIQIQSFFWQVFLLSAILLSIPLFVHTKNELRLKLKSFALNNIKSL